MSFVSLQKPDQGTGHCIALLSWYGNHAPVSFSAIAQSELIAAFAGLTRTDKSRRCDSHSTLEGRTELGRPFERSLAEERGAKSSWNRCHQFIRSRESLTSDSLVQTAVKEVARNSAAAFCRTAGCPPDQSRAASGTTQIDCPWPCVAGRCRVRRCDCRGHRQTP